MSLLSAALSRSPGRRPHGFRGRDPAYVVDLAGLGSLRRIEPFPARAVARWLSDPLPLVLPASLSASRAIVAWSHAASGTGPPPRPGWRPGGPGRTPEEARHLIQFLVEAMLNGTPIVYNAVQRERRGGRVYPYFIKGYGGPMTVSERALQGAHPKLLLSAIERTVREHLAPAEPGWLLVDADYRSCHAAIGLALSGDTGLLADLGGDMHQVTGDRLVDGSAGEGLRRGLGKAANLAMLFGATHHRLRQIMMDYGLGDPGDAWAQAAWAAWWGRYPALAMLRDEVVELTARCQREGAGLEIISPSGWRSRFPPARVRGWRGQAETVKPPEDAWRTIFSALFRSIEGDLLLTTLRHFSETRQEHRGRLALPIYDGMIVGAPADGIDAVQRGLVDAGRWAAEEVGVTGTSLEVQT